MTVADGLRRQVVAFATQGAQHGEAARIRDLLAPWGVSPLQVRRGGAANRLTGIRDLWTAVRASDPDLVVMEGTGLAGGLVCIAGRLLCGTPYLVSGGDAVAPFVAMRGRAWYVPFWLYERILYTASSGYIGWTPYLVGRAITLGARRAMTAAGWAPYVLSEPERTRSRRSLREQLGIPQDAIVIGIVGSLLWSRRRHYTYGLELAEAITRSARTDVFALVVGDGSGLERLARYVPQSRGRLMLPGRIPPDRVSHYLAAMDVASLPQSRDRVGAYRYSTKLPEYVAARLPVVTGQLPLAYDVALDWAWRLPGRAPWDEEYVSALASWMRMIDFAQIAERRRAIPRSLKEFEASDQARRVAAFVNDVLSDESRRQASTSTGHGSTVPRASQDARPS